MHVIKYSGFSLIVIVMIFKIAANIQSMNLHNHIGYNRKFSKELVLIHSTFLTLHKENEAQKC